MYNNRGEDGFITNRNQWILRHFSSIITIAALMLGAAAATIALFQVESAEELVALKGSLVRVSSVPKKDPLETRFTFTVKGHDRIFTLTHLGLADQALLTTEEPGADLKFSVSKTALENGDSRVPVLQLSSQRNSYLSVDTFGASASQVRILSLLLALAALGLAFGIFRKIRRPPDSDEDTQKLIVDPLAVTFAQWLSSIRISPEWATLALEYEEERNRKLSGRPQTEKSNHVKAVDLLLKSGSINALSSLGQTPLHIAAARGHTEAVDLLLRSGADIDIQDGEGNTAIFLAAKGGFLGTVTKLYNAGARITSRNKAGQDLLAACEDGVKEKATVEFTRQALARQSALCEAAKKGDADGVLRALKTGAKVDMPDEAGASPLSLAIQSGNPMTVERILQQGGHATPECLAIAEQSGNPEIFATVHAALAKMAAQAALKIKKAAS